MIVKELDKKDVTEMYSYMVKDFPEDERKPLAMMLAAMDTGNYKGFGLMADEKLLGYAFFFRLDNYYLLDYLAVVDGHRGQGHGSHFLKELCSMLDEDSTIVGELENEAFAESVEEKCQQISRTKFYVKNGFTDTGARAFLFGVHYKLIEFSKKPHSVKQMEKIYLDIYRNMLPSKLFKNNVFIEAQTEA